MTAIMNKSKPLYFIPTYVTCIDIPFLEPADAAFYLFQYIPCGIYSVPALPLRTVVYVFAFQK